eukprot:2871912-Pleurochrysis_carterae.AAC.1
MANVVVLTAAVTAGIIHALSSHNGGHRFAYSIAQSIMSLIAVYTIILAVALSITLTMLPLAKALQRWARSLSQGRKALPMPSHRLAHDTPLSCARKDCLRR